MEFYVALVTTGALTPRLFALNIGDRIWLSPKITGMFTFDQVPEDKNVVMIATGTGLAPYMSMLTTHLMCGSARRFAVLHGARHSWDLGYRSELMTLATPVQEPQLHPGHQPAARRAGSRGPARPATCRICGRSGALDKAWGFHPTPENTHIFLCGARP